MIDVQKFICCDLMTIDGPRYRLLDTSTLKPSYLVMFWIWKFYIDERYLFEPADHVEGKNDAAKIDKSVQCSADDDKQDLSPVPLNEQHMIKLVTYF